MTIRDARSLTAGHQEDLRRRVVRAVREGMTQTEAAVAFGVARGTVNKWFGMWEREGTRALKSGVRGRPKGGQVPPKETSQVVRTIIGRCPDQILLPFALWTREAVQLLLERKYGIDVSVWTVGRYLKQWGLTPQKPLRRAFEQDPKEVRRWLKESYPEIAREAKKTGAEIHWGDEMGLRSDHQVGRSYGKKGRTPVIPGTGQRFRCNMISTITNRGKLAFMIFRDAFTAKVFLRFLKRLLRLVKRPIFLIVDRHSVHRAAGVRAWIRRNAKRLRLFFLPSYSPELNPDEMLNQDVKTNALGRRRPEDIDEMIDGVRSYLWSTQRQPAVVRAFFRKKQVRYAAA